MTQNYQKIGDYISVVDNRNTDGSITNLMGISIDKCYIPSVANVIGTDLHKYKVIRKGQFACSLMQVSRDQRIPLAMYTSDEPAIMSPAYVMFEVNRPDELLPEYLELWFKRAEFDREASFYAVGGVRGSLDWEDFRKMKLPVPSLPEQCKIVHDYKVITDRIELLRKMNENLEEQAYTHFQHTICKSEKDGVLSDLAIITMGTSPKGETINNTGEGEVFYQGRTDFGFRFPTVRLYTTGPVRCAKCGDVLMSVRAPVGDINIAKEDCAIGRGLASIRPKDKCYSFMYYTMKTLYFDLQRFNDEGTVFGSITKDNLASQKVAVLNNIERKAFDEKAKPIDACIRNNEYEIFTLQTLRNNILSGLAKGA